jgi:hypothetical protein
MYSLRATAVVFVLAGVISGFNPAWAGNLYCKIVTVNEVSPAGEPRRLTGKESTRKEAEGTDFVLQRESGLMLGKHVDNAGKYWDTTVVEYGSKEMSYKAFGRNKKGYAFAQYIEVKVWEAGPRKPFVLLDTEILTGYCTL